MCPRDARSHGSMKRPMTRSADRMSTRSREPRGAAVLEVAVMLPLLLLLLLGAIDLGRAASDAITIQSAAQAGAQYGAQDSLHAKDIDGIRQAVLEDLGQSSVGQSVTVDVQRYCNCEGEDGVIDCDTGSCIDPSLSPRMYVRVTIQHDFTTLINYPGIAHVVPLRQTAFRRAR